MTIGGDGGNKNNIPINIEDEMRRSYLDYAMSVIVGRALPDVRDGLKPVHRRTLFMMQEIFPGGRLPTVAIVENHAKKAGFEVALVQPLRLHYARTLDFWAEALEARKDEAIKIQSEEVYERYMHYLTGCAKGFRIGYIDVNQFTVEK